MEKMDMAKNPLGMLRSHGHHALFTLAVLSVFAMAAWWAEYRLRHNGNQRDLLVGYNPIGPFVPGFTVHDLAAGIILGRKGRSPQKISLVLANLTNALYAEFSNATFFQPASRRHLVLNWLTSF